MTDQEIFLDVVARCASELGSISDDWMLFGGAAMVLHGLSGPIVSDIDIVTSTDTAAQLAEKYALPDQSNSASKLFRSDVFVRPDFGPIPVEVMGGFEIYRDGLWVPVTAAQFQKVSISGQTVNLASRHRLKEIFELCGREKDLTRAGRLA